MEVTRKTKVEIIWNGKDVSNDVSEFLSSVTYTDREEEMSDDVTLTFDNSGGQWLEDWYPQEGDTIAVKIGYNDKMLDCGLFEVDEITISGTPDVIDVKTIAAGATKAIRTRNCKAFENQTLKQIAKYFCTKYGFELIDTSSMLNQINLDRKTQENKTDLAFLSELSSEYGFIFSIRGNKMIFISYYDLDNMDAIKDIDKTDVSSYSITQKLYDTYASAEFKSRNPKKGKVIKKVVQETTLQGDSNNVLVVKNAGRDTQNAGAKAFAGIWNKNKMKQTADISMDGDPELVSGISFNLTGLGLGSGKYHILKSTHTISDSGYTTDLEVRKTGTIPKPKRIPKTVSNKKKKTSQLTGSLQDA